MAAARPINVPVLVMDPAGSATGNLEGVVRLALAVAHHALDAFVHPQPGTRPADHR